MVVGLHETERYDSVLDIERCLLQSDRMNGLLAEARAFSPSAAQCVRAGYRRGLLRFLMRGRAGRPAS